MARKPARRGAKGLRPIRRIVTGHDAGGRSIILMDAPSPHATSLFGVPDLGVTDLWRTFGAPADNSGRADAAKGPLSLAPTARGSVFRVVQFPPDRDYVGTFDREKAFASMGESGHDALAADDSRHAAMHRTSSVDYAIVLEGEIWAVMDKGEARMRAGDVLVQRGTNHAWSNRSPKPAFVAFVLIDAKPAV